MSTLLQKLQTDGSGLSFNGNEPEIPNFEGSKLHDTYSITGEPEVLGTPEPSFLDLDNTDVSPHGPEGFLPLTISLMQGPMDFSNVENITGLSYTPGTFISGLSFDNTEELGTFDLGEQ